MNNLTKKLESYANIAIIVLILVVGAVLVKTYLLPGPRETPAENLRGKKVFLRDVDWGKNGQTLLLVLQKGCSFCSESAPFYQRLGREAEAGNTELIALLPHDVNTGRRYLDELGARIDDVRQFQGATLGITSTPTLVLVNDEGVVMDSWVGKLSAGEESAVLERLRAKR